MKKNSESNMSACACRMKEQRGGEEERREDGPSNPN